MATLNVRIDPDLARAFSEACDSLDLTASQVVRAHVRAVVDRHAQRSLDLGFVGGQPATGAQRRKRG